MNKTFAIAAIAAGALSGAFAAAPLQQLMRTPLDPSVMTYRFDRTNVVNPYTTFFNGGETGATVMVWMECNRTHWWAGSSSRVTVYLDAHVTTHPARATKEGGAEVANILDGVQGYSGFTNPLPLSGGTWAAVDALPPTFGDDTNEGRARWKYGCYLVNVVTDSALTLTIGGTEKSVAAKPGETQIFNVVASDASRSVIVAAGSATASVRLGIGRMEPQEFLEVKSISPKDDKGRQDKTQEVTNEWAMAAWRVGILPNGSVTSRCDLLTWYNHKDCGGMTVTQTFPRATFAKDARFVVQASTLGIDGLTNDQVRVWGGKSFGCWLTDAQIENMRDRDVDEMRRRGMKRCWKKPVPYASEVEWIRGDGASWIDTGVSLPNNYFATICRARKGGDTDGNVIWGAQDSNDTNWAFNQRGSQWFVGTTGNISHSVNKDDGQWHDIIAFVNDGTYYLTIDGIRVTDAYDGTVANTGGNSVYLFAVNGGSALHPSKFEIANCQVYNGSGFSPIGPSLQVVADFIPVRYVDENGQSHGAMYDTMSGKMFYNQGPGEFVLGPDIPDPE